MNDIGINDDAKESHEKRIQRRTSRTMGSFAGGVGTRGGEAAGADSRRGCRSPSVVSEAVGLIGVGRGG